MSDYDEIFGGAFDAEQELENNETVKAYEPLPPGWYQTRIDSAGVKTTKAGTGKYVHLCFEVLGPSHEGRKLFVNMNIVNPNEKAQAIGRRELAELCCAIGKPKTNDSSDLIDAVVMVKVALVSENGKDDNEVKGYKAADGSTPAPKTKAKNGLPELPTQAAASAQPQQPQPKTTSKAKMPWE